MRNYTYTFFEGKLYYRENSEMGYVFQNADAQLFCGSVEEEIAFGPVQMGLSEAEIKKRTEDCSLIDKNFG